MPKDTSARIGAFAGVLAVVGGAFLLTAQALGFRLSQPQLGVLLILEVALLMIASIWFVWPLMRRKKVPAVAPQPPPAPVLAPPQPPIPRRGPVAISIRDASDVTLVNNTSIGMPLLDAERVTGLRGSRNRTIMPTPPASFVDRPTSNLAQSGKSKTKRSKKRRKGL